MRSSFLSILFAAAVLLVLSPVRAADLPAPAGPVVLSIEGGVSVTNTETGAAFDLAMLRALGPKKLLTGSEWTEGRRVFEGVLMRVLMNAVGASGSVVEAAAKDGYSIEVPLADFNAYDAILVYAIDGQPLDPADKGPLWIMYPWDVMPADEIEEKQPFAVWQLNKMTVK